MGIQGLLPLLKSIHKHTTLKNYAGQTLGIDAFGWLHRGAVACAFQLANDKPTTQYVAFVVNRVRMLLEFGITPYMVFDGDSVPSKAATNAKRRKDREHAKALGQALFRAGKKAEAQQEWAKAVSITPQMTFDVIEAMRRMNVRVLVAPYEADAQLTYLEREGIIDGILSEDSDLLVFGAQKLITKLDQYGACIEINRADFILNKSVSFAGWSDSMFRSMAILSGCDYLPSVGKVGLKTAHEFVKKHKEIHKILRAMAMSGKYVVPQDYAESFVNAERAFLYHRVFCPRAGRLVLLNTLPPDIQEEDVPQIGEAVEAEIALGIACGDLNPKTKERFISGSQMPAPPRPLSQLHPSRRQNLESANSLKSKASLDSFFRPQRKPLAELDPNSLTPSPSQQRLLERNRTASWEAQPVHNPPHSAPVLRRALTDVSPVSDKSTYLSRAGAPSSNKPAKRQRLCSESDEVSPSKEIKHSKFFSPNVIDQSPLTSKKGRDRKRKTTFDVFSDEPVDDGLSVDLHDLGPKSNGTAVEYPELPALFDRDSTIPDVDVVPQSSPVKPRAAVDDSQSSHGTAALNAVSVQPQQSQEKFQPLTSNEAGHGAEDDAFQAGLQYHLDKHHTSVSASRNQRVFSCQSPETQKTALVGLDKPSRSSDAEKTRSEKSREPEAEVLLSPSAASSAKFQSLARTFGRQTSEMQLKALKSLPRTSCISNIGDHASKFAAKGSEDSITPSSPPEDDLSEAEEPAPRKLDLKSFEYIGT